MYVYMYICTYVYMYICICINFSRGSQRDKKEEEKGRTSEFSTLFMKQKAPPLPPFSARFSENCYD